MTVHHDALIFSADSDLVEGTRDLIQEGLVGGGPVLVLGDDKGGVLREVWGDDARISFADTATFYQRPMRTIAQLQRMLDREGALGHEVRVTGPVPFGDEPATRRGWMLYEALVDRALAPYGLMSVCQYDTRLLSHDLLDHAWATHDRVITATGIEAGGQRRAQVSAELAQFQQPDPLEDEPAVYEDMVTGADDLARIRASLGTAPAEVVLAVNEVVTNAIEHGGRPITVRLHHQGVRWLCAITDHGPGLEDPNAGVDSPLPGNPTPSGYGLWLARQLCDELFITRRPGRVGKTVRLGWWS